MLNHFHNIRPAGYPAILKAGYRISGGAGYRISGRISGYFLNLKLVKQNKKFAHVPYRYIFLFLFPSPFLIPSTHLQLTLFYPFFPFSFSFLSQFLSLYLYPFLSPPCYFPLFALFTLSILFLIPFSFIFPVPPLHFLVSLSPSFSSFFLPSLSSPSPSPVFPIRFFFYSNTWNPELG